MMELPGAGEWETALVVLCTQLYEVHAALDAKDIIAIHAAGGHLNIDIGVLLDSGLSYRPDRESRETARRESMTGKPNSLGNRRKLSERAMTGLAGRSCVSETRAYNGRALANPRRQTFIFPRGR